MLYGMKNIFLLGLAVSCVVSSPLPRPETTSISGLSGLISRNVVSVPSVLTRRSGLPNGPGVGGHHHVGETSLRGPNPTQLFTVNVTFGKQTFEVLFDTGSSDTWLVEKGYSCLSQVNGSKIQQSACNFSSSGFVRDDSFALIPNTNLNVSYSGLQFVGDIGTETVEFAGIKVPKQEVGLVNAATEFGDGTFSGILGFGFPGLTSKFSGTDPSKDVRQLSSDPTAVSNRIEYSSLMHTIFFVENLTEPVFGLALSRDRSHSSFGGLLSIGGVPNPKDPRVNITVPVTSAKTPMEIAKVQLIDPSTPEYQFYVISADSLVYHNSPTAAKSNKTQYVVDSGTPLNYVPDADAIAVNARFNPPAKLTDGNFLVACDATPPEFGVNIAGKTFWTNPYDMVVDTGIGGGICISGVQPGGAPGHYVLGEVFLRNVLAIFDVGKLEMEFLERTRYKS